MQRDHLAKTTPRGGASRATWSRGRGRGRGEERGVGGYRGRGALPQYPPTLNSSGLKPPSKDLGSVPSISRSSGLQEDGDTLKNLTVQEEYWELLQQKVDEHWVKYEDGHTASGEGTSGGTQKRDEARSNIMILFRKLREGIIASHRKDRFALKVFENSLYVSIIFSSVVQTSASLGYLLPHLYIVNKEHLNHPNDPTDRDINSVSTTTGDSVAVVPEAFSTATLSLLHHLVNGYPSQSSFLEHLRSTPASCLPPDSRARSWLVTLAAHLNNDNYVQINAQLKKAVYARFVPQLNRDNRESGGCPWRLLPQMSFDGLLSLLKIKVRQRTWQVLRSSYKEFATQGESGTRSWLGRSLALPVSGGDGRLGYTEDVDSWLARKEELGEVQLKEGSTDRWIVSKKP